MDTIKTVRQIGPEFLSSHWVELDDGTYKGRLYIRSIQGEQLRFIDFIVDGQTLTIENFDATSVNGRTADSFASVDGTKGFTAYIDIAEIAPPGVPVADTLRLYVEDIHGFNFFSFVDDTGMTRKIVRDSVFVARNMTLATIPAFRIVYASGSSGDVPTIAPARANNVATMPAIGVTVESIDDGDYGRVMQVGLIENVNTDAFNVGDVLYVSGTVAGIPVATAPLYPNIRQEIGTILVKDATVGQIQLVARSMFNEGILDHGGLLGLVDDDHAQYLLATGARAGATAAAQDFTNGILIGADCNLYRGAANKITTDDYLGTGGVAPVTPIHADQSSTTAAIPVATLDQADVDEPFINYIGTAAAADLTRSIVDDDDVTTPTLVGWVKVEVEDVGNQIADQDYFMPLYTLV